MIYRRSSGNFLVVGLEVLFSGGLDSDTIHEEDPIVSVEKPAEEIIMVVFSLCKYCDCLVWVDHRFSDVNNTSIISRLVMFLALLGNMFSSERAPSHPEFELSQTPFCVIKRKSNLGFEYYVNGRFTVNHGQFPLIFYFLACCALQIGLQVINSSILCLDI